MPLWCCHFLITRYFSWQFVFFSVPVWGTDSAGWKQYCKNKIFLQVAFRICCKPFSPCCILLKHIPTLLYTEWVKIAQKLLKRLSYHLYYSGALEAPAEFCNDPLLCTWSCSPSANPGPLQSGSFSCLACGGINSELRCGAISSSKKYIIIYRIQKLTDYLGNTIWPLCITHYSIPFRVKLNNGGNSRPWGNLAFGSRSSLKNGCAHASSVLIRALGVYSNKRLVRSIASDGVLGRNTC